MIDAPNTPRRPVLSVSTLVIASAAATAAALITSQLWAHGTILSTAITPLIVTLVSELLHRPSDRVARRRAASRSRPARASPSRDDGIGQTAVDPALPPEQPASHPGRRAHVQLAIATAAAAFAIAAAVLTLPELIFGGAVATKQETTLFGGGTSKHNGPKNAAKPQTATTRTTSTTPTTITQTTTDTKTTTAPHSTTTSRSVSTTASATTPPTTSAATTTATTSTPSSAPTGSVP